MSVTRINPKLQAISEHFNSLNLHDCRLLGIEISPARSSRMNVVRLQLELLGGDRADQWRSAQLTFVECAGFVAKVDLWGKRVCRDAIAESMCGPLSAEIMDILDTGTWRQQEQPLESLLMFTIVLCPPGGELRIVAADFELSESTTS